MPSPLGLKRSAARRSGWQLHPGVPLPGGMRAEAVAIPMKDALGWLVAIGGGHVHDGRRCQCAVARPVALEGVRLAARGVDRAERARRASAQDGALVESTVRWAPALLDRAAVNSLAAVDARRSRRRRRWRRPSHGHGRDHRSGRGDRDGEHRAHGTAGSAAEREDADRPRRHGDRPHGRIAVPGQRRTGDGTVAAARSVVAYGHRSGAPEAGRPTRPARLPGGVWLVSVSAPSGKGTLDPDRRGDARRGRAASARLPNGSGSAGCSRPSIGSAASPPRPGRAEPGRGVGVHDRRRARRWRRSGSTCGCRRCRGARPSRRCGCSPRPRRTRSSAPTSSATSRWSVLFDDVELTADDVSALARQARPLVQSRGRWVEVDRVDLEQAAAALAERASRSRSSPAPRSCATASASTARGWPAASSCTATAGPTTSSAGPARSSMSPVTQPEGFVGALRTYQAEALAWIGFLDAAGLGGCLALDMGLGKTPTVLAHLARIDGDGTDARHRAGRRRRQLGGRGGALHARAAGRRAPRRRRAPRPTSSKPRSPTPTS